MRKYIYLLLLTLYCFSSCKQPSRTTLKDIGVSHINQYVSAMIVSQGFSYSENKVLYIDDLETIIQERLTFLPSGKCTILERGGSEGLITYTEENNYDILKYNIETNFEDDYIVYTNYQGNGIIKDTIRDFIILEDLKIIMSKDDFDVYDKEKETSLDNRSNKVIKFYRYE